MGERGKKATSVVKDIMVYFNQDLVHITLCNGLELHRWRCLKVTNIYYLDDNGESSR